MRLLTRVQRHQVLLGTTRAPDGFFPIFPLPRCRWRYHRDRGFSINAKLWARHHWNVPQRRCEPLAKRENWVRGRIGLTWTVSQQERRERISALRSPTRTSPVERTPQPTIEDQGSWIEDQGSWIKDAEPGHRPPMLHIIHTLVGTDPPGSRGSRASQGSSGLVTCTRAFVDPAVARQSRRLSPGNVALTTWPPGHLATTGHQLHTRRWASRRPFRPFRTLAYSSEFVATMMNTVTSTKPVAFLPTKRGVRISGTSTSRARVATAMRSTAREEDAAVETGAATAAKDVCKTCGVPLSEIPFGCDQSGRIQGGIGAVPGTLR